MSEAISLFWLVVALIAGIALAVHIGLWVPPHLRIDDSVPTIEPPPLNLDEFDDYVATLEAVPDVVPAARARVTWADPSAKRKTALCFLYLHGFSASRLESAPVSAELAKAHGANLYEARVAGHGCGPDALGAVTAEAWLQSAQQAWAIATALGQKVVIVAMSNGASLATWLMRDPSNRACTLAVLMMAPNFRVRSPAAGLLSWPFADVWLPALTGGRRETRPVNDTAAAIWTHGYPASALFRMQTMVKWLERENLGEIDVPLALMYMENDPTVSPSALKQGFRRWGGSNKALIRVEPGGDAAEHVFVGDALAPTRNKWVIRSFLDFLSRLTDDDSRPD